MSNLYAVPLVRPDGLSPDEAAIYRHLRDKLARHKPGNASRLAYYEGTQRVEILGISVPPAFRRIETVVGWPATAVDVLDERIEWLGWRARGGTDTAGLAEIALENDLATEFGRAHLGASVMGLSFLLVNAGGPDEPDVTISTVSATRATGLARPRGRTLAAAWVEERDLEGAPTGGGWLHLPDVVIRLASDGNGGVIVADRDDHNSGRVFVVPVENRYSLGAGVGRSEITPAIRYLTDTAVRTMLGLETSREFYNSPQRYALNISEDAFKSADGQSLTGWESIMGRIWAMPYDEERPADQQVQVGQFAASSPAPYLDQVRGLAQMLASEAGLPASYFGFETANPASADAIRMAESRLVKRAERRAQQYGRAEIEAAILAAYLRGVEIGPGDVANRFRDASTPTQAATTDSVTKEIAAGILDPSWALTAERAGYDEDEIDRMQQERRKARGRALLDGSLAVPPEQQAPPAEVPPNG